MATKSRIKEVESPNGSAPAPAPTPVTTTKVKQTTEKGYIIPQPVTAIMRIKIVGDTPLICSAFPDKLKRQMEEDRQRDEDAPYEETKGTKKGKGHKPRPARDFDQEVRNSLYPIDGGGYGFPAIAFKRAIVSASRNVNGLSMPDANRLIYVMGETFSKGFDVVRLKCSKPIKREDVVRVGKFPDKNPDLRYRAEFSNWECYLNIKFFPNKISAAQLVNLIMWAGITEGVGEMRPSAPQKPFNFGQFHPVPKED